MSNGFGTCQQTNSAPLSSSVIYKIYKQVVVVSIHLGNTWVNLVPSSLSYFFLPSPLSQPNWRMIPSILFDVYIHPDFISMQVVLPAGLVISKRNIKGTTLHERYGIRLPGKLASINFPNDSAYPKKSNSTPRTIGKNHACNSLSFKHTQTYLAKL